MIRAGSRWVVALRSREGRDGFTIREILRLKYLLKGDIRLSK